MLGTPRDVMLSWRRSNNGPRTKRRRLESASNVFYCTFTKQQEYKSQSTDVFFLFFCFVLLLEEVYYANLYLTTAANSPSDESREGESRGELEGLQSHFTACFSSTDVGGKQQQQKKKTKTGKHSCGVHDLRWFWLVLTPPNLPNKHTLCFIMVCSLFSSFFAITTTECNSSFCFFLPPKKVYVLTKGWHIQEDMSFCFYNNRLILHVVFVFLKSL